MHLTKLCACLPAVAQVACSGLASLQVCSLCPAACPHGALLTTPHDCFAAKSGGFFSSRKKAAPTPARYAFVNGRSCLRRMVAHGRVAAMLAGARRQHLKPALPLLPRLRAVVA